MVLPPGPRPDRPWSPQPTLRSVRASGVRSSGRLVPKAVLEALRPGAHLEDRLPVGLLPHDLPGLTIGIAARVTYRAARASRPRASDYTIDGERKNGGPAAAGGDPGGAPRR